MQNVKRSWKLLAIVLSLMFSGHGVALFSQSTVELEKVFSAAGKVNAPLDVALNAKTNHAYVLEQDGDILDLSLTQQWHVANTTRLITLQHPLALTLSKDNQTLLIANGTQLVLLDLSSGATQAVDMTPHTVVAVSAADQNNDFWVAASNGDILRLSLENRETVMLGNVKDLVSDLVYDAKRNRIYLSTQRGTILTFDPVQKTTSRLSFVGPPLGNMDLQQDDLFVASVDFGLYKIGLNLPEPTPFLFFPRVAGPTALVVQEGRALVTNVGEGIVLLDPLDFSGPLASTAQVVLEPALGPVHSLAIARKRQTALVSDRGNTLWSLTTDPIGIASFVFTPFAGRVALHPEKNRFFATNRPGGQVLAMPFDPPFVFSFEMPPISPLIASGLPYPDGVVYLPKTDSVFVATLDDGALWQIKPHRLQAEHIAFLPQGATSIDLDTRQGNVLILLDHIEATGMGRLIEYNPDTQALSTLSDFLPRAIDLAVAGSCIYLVSEAEQLFVLSPTLELQSVMSLPQLSAVAIDEDRVYLGTLQGELFYFSIRETLC